MGSGAVERTEGPVFIERDGGIWIGVPAGTMQCLFWVGQRLTPLRPVGVLLYKRPAPDAIGISHLAVDPRYPARQHNHDEPPSFPPGVDANGAQVGWENDLDVGSARHSPFRA